VGHPRTTTRAEPTDPDREESDETDVASETEAEVEATAEPAAESRSLPDWLAWLLPSLAVLTLIAAAVLGGLLYRQHSRLAAQNAAITAAKQVLINAYSIDYKSVTADYQRFVGGTTGDLHGQLTSGKSKFIQTVQSTHTHESAKIIDAGLVRSNGSTATVAIALDSPLTTSSITKPQTRSYRTEVDVTRVHGRWLASAIRQVG
jgi:hypothetical protein